MLLSLADNGSAQLLNTEEQVQWSLWNLNSSKNTFLAFYPSGGQKQNYKGMKMLLHFC